MRARIVSSIIAVTIACASQSAQQTEPVPFRPLERMAGQQIVVFPVQYLSGTETLGWQQQIPNRPAFLANLDDQIERVFTTRGLGRTWTFGREMERASHLNSILGANARALSAEWLRGRVQPEEPVRDPLAMQVRSLVGLKGSRYAILPVELRLENRAAGTGVAILRLVMIDARLAQIRWVGEVASEPMRTFSPALTASVAQHLADLVVAP